MKDKPIPQALYGCYFCSEEYSRPAEELFWSKPFKAWVCDTCWRDHDEHWTSDGNDGNGSFCEYGISLEEELRSKK
jgi:hypothetical protein